MAYNYEDKLNSMNFITFFKGRYLKIMPLYWITEVCMFCWYLLVFIKNKEWIIERNFTDIFFEFTDFYTGWFTYDKLPVNFSAWTICVLLFCYILFYGMHKFTEGDKNKYILSIIALFFICMNILQCDLGIDIYLIRCLFAFLSGLLLYEVSRGVIEKHLRLITISGNITMLILLITIMIFKTPDVIGDNLSIVVSVYFAPLLILNTVFINPIKWLLSTKPFLLLGKISMGIYLWHGVVLAFFCSKTFGIVNSYKYTIVVLVISLIVATISHFIIEKKLNKIVNTFI